MEGAGGLDRSHMKTFAVAGILLLMAAVMAGCIGGEAEGNRVLPRAVVEFQEVPDKQDTYLFDATRSTGYMLSFHWDFGDGKEATGPRVEHHYALGDGMYDARLTIRDANGVSDFWATQIKVGTGVNEPPIALFHVEQRVYPIGEPIRVDASMSYDPQGDEIRYRWDFNYPMKSYDEYERFRAKKAVALAQAQGQGGGADGDGDAETQGDGFQEDSSGTPEGLGGGHVGSLDPQDPGRARLPGLGDKHPGHGAHEEEGLQRSLFDHVVETDDPVYVLRQGYPEQTVFFIRLQVMDVKGAYEEVLSEEIWPIDVGKAPGPRVIEDQLQGNFTFGGPAEIMGLLPDEEPFDDLWDHEARWSWTTDWPVAGNTASGVSGSPGYINVSWDNPLGLPGEIELAVTAPNGERLSGNSVEGENKKTVELEADKEYGWGEWRAHIRAQRGLDLDWTLDYTIHLDTNPFSEIEAPYV